MLLEITIIEVTPQDILIVSLSMFILFLTVLFLLFLKNNQDEKNLLKKAGKEKEEVDQLFSNTPTGFMERGCTERCYKDLIKKQLANSLN